MKKLTFDIMVGDRFYRTMHMPIEIDTFNMDESVNEDAVKEWVLKKCPTLKYDNFTICF